MRKPRGFYDKDKHSADCLLEFINGRMATLKKNQSDMGKALGITQQAFGYRIDPNKGSGNFDFLQLRKLFKELNATDEEILRLMKQE